MPTLSVQNNGLVQSGLSDPATLFFEKIVPGANAFSVTVETLDNLQEQLEQLDARVDGNGASIFDIDVSADPAEGGVEYKGIADLTRWLANRVTYDGVADDPTLASTAVAGNQRIDYNAGEAFVAGTFFQFLAGTNVVGDGVVDKDGVDVSGDALPINEDVYQHFVFVNNGGSLEVLAVRGIGVDNTGALNAVPLTEDEIATAVGVYLPGASGLIYDFTPIADVLYAESSGLVETVTPLRPAPASFS